MTGSGWSAGGTEETAWLPPATIPPVISPPIQFPNTSLGLG